MRSLLHCSRPRLARTWCRSTSYMLPTSRSFTSTSPPPTPQETAQLSAFTARTGLQFSNTMLLVDALTHTSFKPSIDTPYERLQFLGGKVLGLYVTEHVHMKYPDLPADSVESVVQAYIGDQALRSIGKQFGIQNVMRWKGSNQNAKAGEGLVGGRVLQALVGALYQDKGPKAARQFIHTHFLSRSVDMEVHLKLSNPKALLATIVKNKGQVRPVSRLIKETGRLSTAPVFIVGIYSGLEKIGEGYGGSLAMAETRAVKDALQKHYLAEVKDVTLPSDMEDEGAITFFNEETTP